MKCVAVAGNPNAGKTTLFNALAGTRQKVANYPGVTVEQKEALFKLPNGEMVLLIDLPGCYSLVARSPEEQVAHDVLFGRIPNRPSPSLILCVVDASNLERNLYLATQLIDQGIPLIVVLNMMDLAVEKGYQLDPVKLETVLGCPVIPAVARKRIGIEILLEKMVDILGAPEDEPSSKGAENRILPFIHKLPKKMDALVRCLSTKLVGHGIILDGNGSRAEALWALLSNLEGDEAVVLPPLEAQLICATLRKFRFTTGELRNLESESRYAYIGEILHKAGFLQQDHPHTLTEQLDRIFLHSFFGPILFIAIFTFIFQSIFSFAAPVMDGIDQLFAWLGQVVTQLLPDSMFRDMVLNGVLAGVGNTVIFLPQILILFMFLGLLEDTGYLARAAFIMDRLMATVGLDGKAFIPLLSSFACAVPGIMATRTVPNPKDRLVTILIAPLMACSARLPVYTLIIGTVFVADQKVFGFLNIGGVVMFGLYFMGTLFAIGIALLFKKTLLKSPKPVLLLELPTYKMPSLRTITYLMWAQSMQFLSRATTVILSVTIILWGLLSFPQGGTQQEENVGAQHTAPLQQSYGGQLGRLIEPVIAPLGFDWKIGVGLIASFAAREVFVSTMGVIYGISNRTEEGEGVGTSLSLREALRAEIREETGKPLFTPLVGLSLLVFYVFACQCMATLAVARRETHSWRWPLFMLIYMSIMAYGMSFLVYQGGRMLGYDA
jgi:ferrous iron transport protein B